MSRVLRILDANTNRAREALRVMEEAARFVLEDADLCASIKFLRHELSLALRSIPSIEASRDIDGDVGTALRSESEGQRKDVAEVAIAAGKRLSEALRSIEEYGKTLPCGGAELGSTIEQLRYRGYTVEQRLNRALDTGRCRQWHLCVVLTEALCRRQTWTTVLSSALRAGADCIQLREKDLDDHTLLQRARVVVEQCHLHGASAVVNDRPDIAVISGADGVHLGQDDLPCSEVRRLVGGHLLVGVSTSRLDEAQRAAADGADYCGVGPMFETTTKQKDHIVGPAYARQYLAWDRRPHLAIGGIGPDNIDLLTQAGVRGFAVSSAVCAADDPGNVVRQLLEVIATRWALGVESR